MKNRERLFKSTLLVFSLCFLLVVIGMAEAILRAHKRKTEKPVPPKLTYDAELGWDSIPNLTVLNTPGPQYPTYVFIGDSFTHETSWTLSAQKIAEKAGHKFNGYNLAASGYGTVQEFLKLKKYFDTYQPKKVILLFYAWNDLRDNYCFPAIYYSPESRYRPYYIKKGTDMVLRTAGKRNPFLPWILFRTQGLRAEYWTNRLLVYLFGMNVFPRLRWPLPMVSTFPYSWEPFYEPILGSERYVEESWTATEYAFLLMKKFLDERNCQLLVLGLDDKFTVDTEGFAFLTKPGFDAQQPLRRLGHMLKQHDIAFIDCTPALIALRKETNRAVFNGPEGNVSAHLEEAGYARVGEVAAQALIN